MGSPPPPSFTILSICSSMLLVLPACEEQLPVLAPSLNLLFLDGGFLADFTATPTGSWKLLPVPLLPSFVPTSAAAVAFDIIES